jgi:hypothetical protein
MLRKPPAFFPESLPAPHREAVVAATYNPSGVQKSGKAAFHGRHRAVMPLDPGLGHRRAALAVAPEHAADMAGPGDQTIGSRVSAAHWSAGSGDGARYPRFFVRIDGAITCEQPYVIAGSARGISDAA